MDISVKTVSIINLIIEGFWINISIKNHHFDSHSFVIRIFVSVETHYDNLT